MTRQEIMDRIEEIENRRFYIAMIDRWTQEDYNRDTELLNEERELQRMLENA